MLKFSRLIKDKDGHIVLWQSPNLLLSVWLILKIVEMLIGDGRLKSGLEQLSTAVLFAWAYFELVSGVNYFRRALGLVVLIVTIAGFFR